MHQQRTVPFNIHYLQSREQSGGLIGSSDQGYYGISPFSVWAPDFSASNNAWLWPHLSKVNSVCLTFTGNFQYSARLST